MQADLLQGFFLGDLLVEPVTGQVSGKTGSGHLPPKAAEVLLRLAEQPGEVVERSVLLDAVWGRGKGSPEALSHAVAEIRHVLEDHANDPRFIQTLPRRGYRLIVTPRPAASGSSAATLENLSNDGLPELPLFESLKRRGVIETAIAYMVTGWLIIQIADVVFDQLLLPRWAGTFVTLLVITGFPIALLLSWFLEFRDGRAYLDTRPDRATPTRRIGRAYLSTIGAMLVASVGVFVYDQFVGLPEEEVITPAEFVRAGLPPVQENSIAVLPFFNIDGSNETQIFAHGFAEDVINRLATIPGLAVAARGDAWTLAPNSASADVRRRLRVAYYLEGSVRIADGVIRVVVQLIDSETGFHIVSRDFERDLEAFNQVQREITDLTIANLKIALPADTQAFLNASYTATDVDAYVLYRRGREIYERPRTLETLDEVIDYYRQALELDPRYAAAHAGLCEAHVSRFEYSGEVEDIRKAETACNEAINENPRLYIVYAALGTLYRRTGQVDQAERAYDEALRINAQSVPSMVGLATIYRRQQKFEQAEELLRKAISLQPGNWRTIDSLGTFLFRLGRYNEAAAEYNKIVALDPTNSQAVGNLGSALMMAGDFEAAKDALEKALDRFPDGRFYSNLGIIYYYLGRFDDSVELQRAAVEESPSTTLLWLNLGDALHFADRTKQAEEAFRRAVDLAEAGLEIDPSAAELLTVLAWARQMLGDVDEALALIQRALSVAPKNPYSHYYLALVLTMNGDHDAAVRALNQAVELGYPVMMLTAEPYLEPLRSQREFRRLIARAK